MIAADKTRGYAEAPARVDKQNRKVTTGAFSKRERLLCKARVAVLTYLLAKPSVYLAIEID